MFVRSRSTSSIALSLSVAALALVACRADDDVPTTDAGRSDMAVPPPPGDGGSCPSAAMENTAALCSDGCSNDGDPFVDCDDFDCTGIGSCPGRDGGGSAMACPGPETPEDTPAACGDGCSNDGDRFADCDDFDCTGIGSCPGRDGGGSAMACPGPEMPEESDAACSDGCSNDGDRFADCDDFDCEGFADCPGTPPTDAGPPATTCATVGPENTAAACSDGCSNDCDRFADCDDFDCAGLAGCPARDASMPMDIPLCAECGPENTPAACSDGCSNDGNRFVDCDDRACSGIGSCPMM